MYTVKCTLYMYENMPIFTCKLFSFHFPTFFARNLQCKFQSFLNIVWLSYFFTVFNFVISGIIKRSYSEINGNFL